MYIVIAGAGQIGCDLARELLEKKHDVVIIDKSKDICDRAYADTGVIAVCGSIASIQVVREAGIEKADVAVAATGRDGDNLTFAVLAKSHGVPRVIVRMRNPSYENAYRVAGVSNIVRVTDLMINQMLVDIEQPDVRRLTRIGGGKADVFVVEVPEGGKVAGKNVRDIVQSPGFPSECVIIASLNKATGEFAIPRGDRVISEGDELFLIATASDIKAAADVLIAKEEK